ncbi:hypothetical protein DVH02_34495, partial [Streptomyces corynorhini]
MVEPKAWRFAAGSAVVGLTLAAVVVAAAGPWDSGQRKAERDWAVARSGTGGTDHGGSASRAPSPAPSAAAVLAGLTGSGTATAGQGKGTGKGTGGEAGEKAGKKAGRETAGDAPGQPARLS